jgi:hypothetical protein
MATNQWITKEKHPTYFCANASRKHHHQYRHDFASIRQRYQDQIVFENAYPYPISIAMGDYFFLAKFTTREQVEEFYQFVYAK